MIAAGTGHEYAAVVRRDAGFRFHALQEIQQRFHLARFMPAIVLPQNCIGFRIHDDGFDGCGTYIDSGTKFGCSHCILLILDSRFEIPKFEIGNWRIVR